MSESNCSCWVLTNTGGLGKDVGGGWVWLDKQGGLSGGGMPRKLNGREGMALLLCEQRQERC